jgi:hypothetical protein
MESQLGMWLFWGVRKHLVIDLLAKKMMKQLQISA